MLPSCKPKDYTYQTHDQCQVHTGKSDRRLAGQNQFVNHVVQVNLILPTYHDYTRFFKRRLPTNLVVLNQLSKQKNDKQQEYLVHAHRYELQITLIAFVVFKTVRVGLSQSGDLLVYNLANLADYFLACLYIFVYFI
jgi:hypothetical protein